MLLKQSASQSINAWLHLPSAVKDHSYGINFNCISHNNASRMLDLGDAMYAFAYVREGLDVTKY